MSYYEFVKGESPDQIAKDLSHLAQNGKFPCGNLFCDDGRNILRHAAAKKKISGHIPEKVFYAAVGKTLDELMKHVNDLNNQADYVVMGDVFLWVNKKMWIQMMVLSRFAKMVSAE